MREEEVKSYKWVRLQQNPPKNAVLYVLDPRTREVELFVTDRNGVPKPVNSYVDISKFIKLNSDNGIIVNNNQLFVKKYNEGDDYIIIDETDIDYKVKLNIDKVVSEVVDIVQNTLGDKNYIHDQSNPEHVWTILHNLNKVPSITTIDTAGTVVNGRVVVINLDRVVIEFNFPFSGKAILN